MGSGLDFSERKVWLMAWTEDTPIAGSSSKEAAFEDNLYDLSEDSETIWDGGSTFWDVDGNVERTEWDRVRLTDSWSKESGV